MKKSTLLLLFVIQFGYSQTYTPLLDQSNQWHVTNCYYGCLTDVYYTDGDTLVNGFSHKILDGYHFISRTFLLKENVSTKKVYLTTVHNKSILEYLLYDFSLAEGETFNMVNPITPFPQNGGPFVLDSIRMKPILNNIDYKHFYFSPTPSNSTSTANVVWIEGIGSKSLINAPGGAGDINGAGQLSCFFKNSTLVYSQLDSISECDYQILENEKFTIEKSEIVKANLKNHYYITNSNTIENVEIYNATGKRLKSLHFKNNALIELNLENYSKNIYFILAFDAMNRKKYFKIIVE